MGRLLAVRRPQDRLGHGYRSLQAEASRETGPTRIVA